MQPFILVAHPQCAAHGFLMQNMHWCNAIWLTCLFAVRDKAHKINRNQLSIMRSFSVINRIHKGIRSRDTRWRWMDNWIPRIADSLAKLRLVRFNGSSWLSLSFFPESLLGRLNSSEALIYIRFFGKHFAKVRKSTELTMLLCNFATCLWNSILINFVGLRAGDLFGHPLYSLPSDGGAFGLILLKANSAMGNRTCASPGIEFPLQIYWFKRSFSPRNTTNSTSIEKLPGNDFWLIIILTLSNRNEDAAVPFFSPYLMSLFVGFVFFSRSN